MKEIFKYLGDDTLYRKTLSEAVGFADLVDLNASYNPSARRDYLKKEAYVLDYYDDDVDVADLFGKSSTFFNQELEIGELHRTSNTRLDYLLSTMKNISRTHEIMLLNSDLKREKVLRYIVNARKIQDVRETVMIKEWYSALMKDIKSEYEKQLIQVKHLRSRADKLINVIQQPIVIMDMKGRVTNLNEAAINYFALWNPEKELHILSLLDFHYASFDDFMATFDSKPVRQLGFTNGDQMMSEFFQLDRYTYMLSLTPLNQIEEKHVDHPDLTNMENIVLNHISQGMSTKQIALKLNLSDETVKTHRKQIRRKLGLINRKTSIPKYIHKGK